MKIYLRNSILFKNNFIIFLVKLWTLIVIENKRSFEIYRIAMQYDDQIIFMASFLGYFLYVRLHFLLPVVRFPFVPRYGLLWFVLTH